MAECENIQVKKQIEFGKMERFEHHTEGVGLSSAAATETPK